MEQVLWTKEGHSTDVYNIISDKCFLAPCSKSVAHSQLVHLGPGRWWCTSQTGGNDATVTCGIRGDPNFGLIDIAFCIPLSLRIMSHQLQAKATVEENAHFQSSLCNGFFSFSFCYLSGQKHQIHHWKLISKLWQIAQITVYWHFTVYKTLLPAFTVYSMKQGSSPLSTSRGKC